jgi:hypothetical protein
MISEAQQAKLLVLSSSAQSMVSSEGSLADALAVAAKRCGCRYA